MKLFFGKDESLTEFFQSNKKERPDYHLWYWYFQIISYAGVFFVMGGDPRGELGDKVMDEDYNSARSNVSQKIEGDNYGDVKLSTVPEREEKNEAGIRIVHVYIPAKISQRELQTIMDGVGKIKGFEFRINSTLTTL